MILVSSSWGLMRQGGSYHTGTACGCEGEAWGRGHNLEEGRRIAAVGNKAVQDFR